MKKAGDKPGLLLNLASFPAQDALHSGCMTTTVVQEDCASTYAQIDATIKGYGAGGPANGIYKIVSEKDNQNIWVTRTTPTKHYVEDIEFTLTPSKGNVSAYNTSGETCFISAQSRAESNYLLSGFWDYDTNYCNMWNVMRGSGLDFHNFKTVGSCSGTPSDAERLATCNQY